MNNAINVNIEGVFIRELTQISDERGSILHMIKSSDSNFQKFGEVYFSEILPGKVKAWKFHKFQSQNITVPLGSVMFVIYDDRMDSKTYRNFYKIKIGRPNSYFLLHIPAGVWYGFKSLSCDVSIVVNCADIPHDKEESLKREIFDDYFDFNWDLV